MQCQVLYIHQEDNFHKNTRVKVECHQCEFMLLGPRRKCVQHRDCAVVLRCPPRFIGSVD